MTGDQAQRYVLGGLVVAGGFTAVRDVTRGTAPTVRTALGVVVGGVLLSLLAGPAPELAAGLSLLVGVSAVLSTGPEVLGALSKGLT